MMQIADDFYVYILYRDDGITPLYVGKGRGSRIDCHTTATQIRQGLRYNPALYNAIQRILDSGFMVHKKKVAENLTEQVAFKIEKILIRILGRRDLNTGPLWNLTDGGEGQSGKICTEETRKKLSIAGTGRPAPKISVEGRERKRLALLGRKDSDETRKRKSEAHKGRKSTWTLESRAKASASRIGKKKGPHSEEHKRKIAESQKGKNRGPQSEEHKKKRLESLKKRFAEREYVFRPKSNETVKKIAEANTGKKRTLEQRKRISDSLVGKKFSEERRRNISLAHIGYHPSDEAREKMRQAQRLRRRRERRVKKLRLLIAID